MHDEHSAPHAHQYESGHEVHIHQSHSPLRRELVSHLPISVASVALGLVLAGIICFLTPPTRMASGDTANNHAAPTTGDTHDHGTGAHDHDTDANDNSGADDHDDDAHDNAGAGDADEHRHGGTFQPLFHLFHPMHMFFSAAATTAMFWRYDRRLIRAVLVGFTGAVVVCGISDILVPHAALAILGHKLHLHICIIEHPGLVLPFSVIGVGVGLLAAAGVSRSTFFSHSLHVFTSTMASIFYMITAYGRLGWIDDLGWVFFFVVLAVMVPCCLSDIIFPVAMSRPAQEAYSQTECCH